MMNSPFLSVSRQARSLLSHSKAVPRLQQQYFSTSGGAGSSTPPAVRKPTGASLLQRLSSFLVGAGLTALGTQYYIWQELHHANGLILEKQMEIEKRLQKLEKK